MFALLEIVAVLVTLLALYALIRPRGRVPSRLLAVAWFCACAGGLVHLWYLFIGFAQGTDEVCAAYTGRAADAFTGLDETAFPRSYVCRWADGSTTDLVPWWVNPVLFLTIAAVAGCTAAAVAIAVRRTRRPSQSTVDS